MIYRAPRGDYVRRGVNGWGYIDGGHAIEKASGITRIGFFGDSFTEARQLPLDETFHKIIEVGLNGAGRRAECIAIAMSGYGTFQSYLECTRWADSLSIDHLAPAGHRAVAEAFGAYYRATGTGAAPH